MRSLRGEEANPRCHTTFAVESLRLEPRPVQPQPTLKNLLQSLEPERNKMKPMLLLLSVLGFCIASKGFDEFTHTFVKPQASLLHIAQCMRLLKPHGEMRYNAGSSRKSVDDHRLADANLGASFVTPLKLSSKWRLSSRFSPMAKLRRMLDKTSANTADHKVKAKNKSSYVNPMHCIRCSKHKATDKARRTSETLNL